MGAALAMAQAEGCDAHIAADLLRQAQWGMAAAQKARRQRDKGS